MAGRRRYEARNAKRPTGRPLVRVTRSASLFFLSAVGPGATHVASDGLIWPKGGCASIACAAMADGLTF
jgi:hypothetical protein